MSQNSEIKKLYSQLHSYAAVGRVFHLSRQRVHQIVRDYRNIGRTLRRLDIYETDDPLCRICRKNKWKVAHHKDFNNKNDSFENNILVCIPCHMKLHKDHRNKITPREKCRVCGNIFLGMPKSIGNIYHFKDRKGLCDTCVAYFNKYPDGKGKTLRDYQILKQCRGCGREFSKKIAYVSKNLCRRCFDKTPERRRKHAIAMRKYHKKRYSNDLEYRKKISEYNKKYYYKNRLTKNDKSLII